MVPLLEEIGPEYYKYFIYSDKRRSKCMYSEAKKAIYGNPEVSLLFLEVLPKRLVMHLVFHRWPSWLMHTCTSFRVYL